MSVGGAGTPAAASAAGQQLPSWRSVLAVVAHPDDESFGLGAVLTAFGDTAELAVLCFTHGEASTLHGVGGELRIVRESELRAAGDALGLDHVVLLDHADGRLASTPPSELAAEVVETAERTGADGLVTFDPAGVTGHPDHVAATAATLEAAARMGLPLLAWALPAPVAATLNAELGASFIGSPTSETDLVIQVDRTRQRAAVSCHRSQAVPGSVLWRRLQLQGDLEHLRWLHREPDAPGTPPRSG